MTDRDDTLAEMQRIGKMMFKHPTLGPQVAAYAELVAGRECTAGPEACPRGDRDLTLQEGLFPADTCPQVD